LEENRPEEHGAGELNRTLMHLPARRRLDAILARVDGEAVVAGLAEQDFYFFVKEIGTHDALPLLALASFDQINHLFDLEWWQKDTVLPAKAVEWLALLAKASEDKLLAWLYKVDFELLVTLFKKWLRVALIQEDEDPLEAGDSLPKHTLDDQYYFESRYPQYEDFLKGLLSLIFEVHYGFYKELMNHVIAALDTAVEEEAYRFHRGRLEDRAIPDYFDALEIYRSLRPAEVVPAKGGAVPASISSQAPSFALALLPERDLLSRVLLEIRDREILNTVQWELASLANKVMVADQLPPDSMEALLRAVEKMAAYVNLGLEIKSKGHPKTARKVVEQLFLEHLFRLGQTQVARLRDLMRKVRERGWLSRWPAGLNCLDADWLEPAELMLAKTPMLLRPASTSDSPPRQDFFRSQHDLLQAKQFIDIVMALGLLFDSLCAEPERIENLLWTEGQIRELRDVTLGSMIWTAAARFRHEGKRVVDPIPVALWPDLFPLLGPGAMEDAIRLWVHEIAADPTQRVLLSAYLDPLYRAYEEETAPFLDATPPDPRLMKLFLFRRL
jgi:hypothetical protein